MSGRGRTGGATAGGVERAARIALVGDSITARAQDTWATSAISCVNGICTVTLTSTRQFSPGSRIWLYGKYGANVPSSFKGVKTIATRIDGTNFTYNGTPGETATDAGTVSIVDYGRGGDGGYGHWLRALLEGRGEVLVFGQSGAKSSQVLEFMPLVLAQSPTIVVEMSGTNDATTNIPAATVIANRAAYWDACHAAGITVIAAYLPPKGNIAAPDRITAYNAAMRDAALSRPWLKTVDFFRLLVDPLSATAAPSSTLIYTDLVHPTTMGARLMADALYAVLSPLLPTSRPQSVSSNYQVAGTDPSAANIFPNPMLNGTDGTITGGTGVAASNVNLLISGVTGCVGSVVANAYGPGQAQRVVLTATAAGQYGGCEFSGHGAALVAGRVYRVRMRLSVSAATGVQYITLRHSIVSDGVNYSDNPMNSTGGVWQAQDAYGGKLIEHYFICPPIGTLGTVKLTARADFAGAGGATLEVAEVAIEAVSGWPVH